MDRWGDGGTAEVFLLAFLMWAAIYLPGLGEIELQQGEEGRRILWLVPHIGGQAYYRKPPVINWVVAGSFLLTGQHNEFAARLPSALFILFFVALLIWFPGGWPNIETRLITAVIFLTTFAVVKKGREIEIEGVYISLTAMAVFIWLALWARNDSCWALWLLPSILLACGMLTKGPPIFLFYYATVIGVLAYSKRLRALLSLQHPLSLVLCLDIPALWAYLAARQAADGRAATDLSSEVIARLTSTDIDWAQWLKQLGRAVPNPLPWAIFIPLLWRRDFLVHIPASRLPLFKGARLGLAVSFVGITMIPGNSGRYSMPAIGLESLLLGWVLAQVGELPDQGRLWRRFVLIGFGVAILLAVVGVVAIRTDLWTVVLLSATVCLAVVLCRQQRIFHAPVSLAVISALLGIVLALQYSLFLPRMMEREEKRWPIAAALNALLPDREPLYVYHPGFQDFLFYVREPVEYLTDPAQIDGRVRYLLLHDTAYEQLQPSSPCSKTLHRFEHRANEYLRLVELLPTAPQAQNAAALVPAGNP